MNYLKWQRQCRPDLDPFYLGKNFDSRYGFSEAGKRCMECMFMRGESYPHCIIQKVWPMQGRCHWFKDAAPQPVRAREGTDRAKDGPL